MYFWRLLAIPLSAALMAMGILSMAAPEIASTVRQAFELAEATKRPYTKLPEAKPARIA